MLTEGAPMRRVDHPGSPGAEAVVVRGESAGGPVGDAPEPALAESWGRGNGPVVTPELPGLPEALPWFGRRSRAVSHRAQRGGARRAPARRGRVIGAKVPVGRPRDIAWEATLRAVAHSQRGRRRRAGLSFAVDLDELVVRRRVSAPDHLLMLVVDASGSMAGRLTRVARDLAVRALEQAYVERQRVAMIAFRARGAKLLFGPTTSVERARRALDRLPLGGATPLGRGLDLTHQTLRRAAIRDGYLPTTVLVISDGDANVGNRRGYGSAHLDVEQACRKLLSLPNTEFVLIDTTERGKDQRPARWVVDQLRARHVRLDLGAGD